MKGKGSFFLVFVVAVFGLTVGLNATEGASIYNKHCAGCHGKDGTTKAFGRSEKINKYTAEEIYEKVQFFIKGDFSNAHGSIKVMSKKLKSLSDDELNAVSEYVGSFGR